jgi:subtilisin family serine protease
MRQAGETVKGWPVATALATLLAILAGLHSGITHARDDPKESRKKPAVVRTPAAKAQKLVPHGRTATGNPALERKREGVTTPRTLGPAKSKEHDTTRARTAKTDSKAKEPRKALDTKGSTKALGTKSALTKAGPNTLPRGDRTARRVVNAPTPQLRQVQRVSHRNDILAARARLPVRPFPGERNFTGVPPAGERRFVSTELVFQAGANVTQQQIDDMARRHNCVPVATQRSALTGGTLIRFRIAGGQDAADMVRAMEAERLGIAQPNYVYDVVQQPQPPAQASQEQYVADKLKLAEVHKIATGKGVLVAVIDSQIDVRHPELGSAIAESFDAVGQTDKPHAHGTGMLGAIVSQGKLMGIAPGAKALAVHAFATGSRQSPQATTQAIIAGLEFALEKGARIVNMSFAGPYDPMLQVALKKAAERGAILIAAVGNKGPKSPPLYPAADPNVIGVTATDQNDAPYDGANRGAYVALAAPGVNILAPAPEAAYQLTTGTSIAAAHVSGVAALLLERHPNADGATILEVLTASATRLTADARDDRVGWGLIDPAGALSELDARIADSAVATSAPPPAPAPTISRVPAAPPAPARSALPRPGIYAPK